MTYGDMNLIFLVIAGIAAWVIKSRFRCFTTPIVLLPILILTAVFDNFIILAGIVDYDATKLMGIYVGAVPIEDFAYTVVAVLLVPAIWRAANK